MIYNTVVGNVGRQDLDILEFPFIESSNYLASGFISYWINWFGSRETYRSEGLRIMTLFYEMDVATLNQNHKRIMYGSKNWFWKRISTAAFSTTRKQYPGRTGSRFNAQKDQSASRKWVTSRTFHRQGNQLQVRWASVFFLGQNPANQKGRMNLSKIQKLNHFFSKTWFSLY